MLFRKALSRFGFAAMRLAVRTLGLLDPHFDPLRQARVGVPELWSTARERRHEALSRDAVHATTVAQVF
jgi:hypothetical protein